MQAKNRQEYTMELVTYVTGLCQDPMIAAEIFETELWQLNEWTLFDVIESQDWQLAWQTAAMILPLSVTLH